MIRISLPDDDLQRLEEALRAADDPKLRHRVQIVLMAHRGRRHPDIAADTGTSPRSVQRWLNAYLDRGLDGLRPRKAPGAKPKLTPDLAPVLRRWVIDGPVKQGLDRANWTYAELADEVKRWVIEGPAAQGLDRANWTHEELADHLLKTHGIRIGKSAMQAFGAKHGIRPYRPTYTFLRGNPAKQQTAREELADLKKGRTRGASSC